MREHKSIVRLYLCSAFLMACSSGADGLQEGTFEVAGDQISFRGTGSIGALSLAERKAYVDDRQYMGKLAPRGVAIELNHADPRQHRFALLRMKVAGKTAENSPQLFRLMEEAKAADIARGLARGTVVTAAAADGSLASQHLALTTDRDSEVEMMQAGALASRKDQLSYGYVDSTVWDDFGNALGDTEYVEVFGNMRYSVAQSDGDLEFAEGENVEGDSFLSEVLASTNKLHQSYIIAADQAIAAAPSLNTPVVQRPADQDDLDQNGFLVVCLERQWTGDCEYNNTGMLTLRLPLKGSISVAGAGIIVDAAEIARYKTDAGPSPGQIYATLATSGGGCTLPSSGQNMNMKDFWRHVTTSPAGNNPITMSWDMSITGDWASFSESCRLVQDTVYVTMNLQVPFRDTIFDTGGTMPVTISNAATQRPLQPPNFQIQRPLRITNSCLAAGTLVSVPGSAARKIEELRIGEKVANPYAKSLTITDRAVGTERSPMVHIADTRGRELLLTEMHPLYVVGRGMVPAKLLQVGDQVKTDEGTSELVRVTREAFGGQVFNLKVGTPEEASALGPDETAVYANGFLVGDGQIQEKVELREQVGDTNAATRRLSTEWRQDYQTSLGRAGSHE